VLAEAKYIHLGAKIKVADADAPSGASSKDAVGAAHNAMHTSASLDTFSSLSVYKNRIEMITRTVFGSTMA
jgi:hypothetical protein